MDPLVDGGLFNPRNRPSWGAVLKGQPHLSGQQTERAGICLTKAHHFYYVWGDDVGPEALGKAMQLAGCDFGMHLDMNPFHTGFVFLSFTDARYQQGQSVTLTPLMAIGNRRYIDYNPKDFFFATLRDPKSPLEGPFEWQPDAVIQPAPAWFPGIFHATSNGVEVIAIEPHRVRWVRARVPRIASRANRMPASCQRPIRATRSQLSILPATRTTSWYCKSKSCTSATPTAPRLSSMPKAR